MAGTRAPKTEAITATDTMTATSGGFMVLGIVSCVVWIGFLALMIMCIVKATQGQRFRIPILTDIAEKLQF